MAVLNLKQLAPFQLVGVTLKPETHEYTAEEFAKLNAEPSFHLTVATGLIEIVEAPKAEEPQAPEVEEPQAPQVKKKN